MTRGITTLPGITAPGIITTIIGQDPGDTMGITAHGTTIHGTMIRGTGMADTMAMAPDSVTTGTEARTTMAYLPGLSDPV